MKKISLLIFLAISTFIFLNKKPNELYAISYIDNQQAPLENSGVITPYKQGPKDKSFLIDCSLYDTNMNLIHRFVGNFCNPHIHKENIFKEKIYFSSIDHMKLHFIDSNGYILWSKEGNFHHDATMDKNSGHLYVLDEITVELNNHDYRFTDIKVYDISGNLIKQWSPHNKIDQLTKIGQWKKDQNNVLFPISARRFKRNLITGANFIHVLDKDWGIVKSGSIIIYEQLTQALIALDPNSLDIIWHSRVFPVPEDNKRAQRHTPVFLDNGNYLIFNNMYFKDNKLHNAVMEHSQEDLSEPKIKYIVPELYNYEERALGNIQIFSDQSLIVTTANDHGGIIHLNKDNEVIFQWSNPKTDPEFKRPVSIYRAILIPNSWIRDLHSLQ